MRYPVCAKKRGSLGWLDAGVGWGTGVDGAAAACVCVDGAPCGPTKRMASATTTPSALSLIHTLWPLPGSKSKVPSCCQLPPLIFWLTDTLVAFTWYVALLA